MIHPDLRIVLDPGSCHQGHLDLMLALVDAAADAGAWGIKPQLFPDQAPYTPTNICFDPAWIPAVQQRCRERRLELFFSIFGSDLYFEETVRELRRLPVPIRRIKFANGSADLRQRLLWSLDRFDEVIVTAGMDDRVLLDSLPHEEKLTVLYPSPYPADITYDFGFLRRKDLGGRPRWHGWSDHSFGTHQTFACAMSGAQMIEKHLRLPATDEIRIRDARFAVTGDEMASLTERLEMLSGRQWKRGARGLTKIPESG